MGKHKAKAIPLWVTIVGVLVVMSVWFIIIASITHRSASNPMKPAPQTVALSSHAPAPSASESAPIAVSPSQPVASPSKLPSASPTKTITIYTVKPGDNLSIIAAWFKVDLNTFYNDNIATVGKNWDVIYPGQKLRIVH